MANQYKIYLDVCCLNRPFDDWSQPRVRLEAEAILAIIGRIQADDWLMISSTALVSEIAQTPEPTKRQQVMDLLAVAKIELKVTPEHIERAANLQTLGFKPFDALHIACAEAANADVLITTDDRLLRKATTYTDQLHVQVQNPLHWMIETNTEMGGQNHDDPS